jgi:phosphatidylserine/phosphatidylglycerophosphate/cardiolipin synthase-like enzyme
MKNFLLFAALFIGFGACAQMDILDARTNYDIDEEVTVTGIVTSGDEFGSVRYLQDATAGIAIYPGTNWDGFDEPMPGDEIVVTGVLSEFSGLLEVGPDLSEVTIVSSMNDLPTPQIIAADAMAESDEGELVTVENCFFAEAGSVFGSNSTHSFVANGLTGILYIRSSNPLGGTTIPFGDITLTGVVSQFSNTGTDGYQLLPRGASDLFQTSTLNLSSPVDQVNVTTTSFDLEWATDAPGNSMVNWGLTADNLDNSAEVAGAVTSHTIELTGLEPATVYWCQVSSTDGDNTALSTVIPFITRSNSSGEMKVYFTGSVDTSVATDEDAISLGSNTNDTFAELILQAQNTLDIAAYNIDDPTIENAINTAYDNGVQIRYIAQGTNANFGIDAFNSGIPVLYREDDLGSGMHNKFIIIDADDADNAMVITGSTNLTPGNLTTDFNNIITFQEQSIARGFELEFEEMWGSTGAMFDEDNAKFGAAKTNNTPKNYFSGDAPVEVYFSPSDNTTSAIINAIATTQYEMDFCVLAFTRDDIAEAVITVQEGFSSFARGIIEQVSTQGSEYEILLDNGVDVQSHQGVSGDLHHKYGIVDPENDDSDPTVITGSHNWSSSAENFNDENTVFVHDARVANLYFQEFTARFGNFVNVEENEALTMDVYPNPANDYAMVALDASSQWNLQLIDAQGRLISQEFNMQGLLRIDLSHLPNGYYSIIATSANEQLTQKLIVR